VRGATIMGRHPQTFTFSTELACPRQRVAYNWIVLLFDN
jgi:hypothetical protein